MENLRGIGLMILAMACFTTGDMFLKLASERLATGEILVIMGIGGAAIFWIWLAQSGQVLVGRDLWHWAIIIRTLSEMIGTIGMITALVLADFTSVASITQAMPLVVTLGAALLLREAVGWRRWAAILVGFCGVLIIIRPGLQGFDTNALWAVLAVFGLGFRDLFSRPVPKSISTLRIAAIGFLSLIPTGLILIPFGPDPVAPSLIEWGQLTMMIALTAIGYYAVTSAMRMGDVAVIAPFRYSRLIFALAVGVVVFGDRPDAYTLIGAAITVLAGIYVFLREADVKRAS